MGRGGHQAVSVECADWFANESAPQPIFIVEELLLPTCSALPFPHGVELMLLAGNRNRRYGSVTELAAGEKLDRGYLGKILILTLLAPDIVEAILDGRQPAQLGVHVLREGFPVEWGSRGR